MRLPPSAGTQGAGDELAGRTAVPDEMLRVPARRLVQMWAAVAIGAVLATELDVGRWLSAPVLASLAVTVGLAGTLALARRQQARAAARWPLSDQRKAAARWN
jgi:hypothetical protein